MINGLLEGKEGKEKERGTQVGKNGNEKLPIDNNLKREWIKCSNQKT